jgi:hypothetical protein
LLRTGTQRVPDESALTSTAWMGGVFHSMLTQGHVSINRCLSTVRSYSACFARTACALRRGRRRLAPARPAVAFEMRPDGCRWIYRHAAGAIEVRSEARSDPHALGLDIDVVEGRRCAARLPARRADGDDGSAPGGVTRSATAARSCSRRARRASSRALPERPLAHRAVERRDDRRAVAGDELLFADGAPRELPYLVLQTAARAALRFTIVGRFVDAGPDVPMRDRPTPRRTPRRLEALSRTVPADGAARCRPAPPRRAAAVAAPERADPLPRTARPRAVLGRRLGHARRLPGPGRAAARARRPAPMRDLLLRVMKAQRPTATGRSGSCSSSATPRSAPATRTATSCSGRCSRSAST